MLTQMLITTTLLGPQAPDGELLTEETVDCNTYIDAQMAMMDAVMFYKAQGLELFDEGKTFRYLGNISGQTELTIELDLRPHPYQLN